MWICSTIGFFSIVKDQNDANRLLVRARDRVHLERFADQIAANTLRRYMPASTNEDLLPELSRAPAAMLREQIIETPDRDYRFRLRLHHEDVIEQVAKLTKEIDYSNFKDAVASVADKRENTERVGDKNKRFARVPLRDMAYLHALHDVWSVMRRHLGGDHG
jgi:hypothetical protein